MMPDKKGYVMKKGELGERLCDENNCELPATNTLVWSKQVYYCPVHTDKALHVAQLIGFATPANTLRPMTVDEMMPEAES